MSETPDELEPGVEPFADTFPSPRGGVNAGIPYPSPTDDLMAGASAMQAIADYLAHHGYGDYVTGASEKPTGTNLNTLVATGLYGLYGGVNAPTAGYIFVRVLAWSGSYILQEVATFADTATTGARWTRENINGTWTSWRPSPPRIIAGIVNANGTIYSGSGFTVVRSAAGTYQITLTQGFTSYPSVVVTPSGGGMTFTDVENLQPGSFRVEIRSTGGVLSDVGFSFQAIST